MIWEKMKMAKKMTNYHNPIKSNSSLKYRRTPKSIRKMRRKI